MKQVFIFVGEARTGKTVLGNILSNADKTIVFDDISSCKPGTGLKTALMFNQKWLRNYDYAIYITNNPDNIDIIKNHFPDTPVSVCEFRSDNHEAN